MIARLVLNLLKSRDTIAVLQRSIAFTSPRQRTSTVDCSHQHVGTQFLQP